MDTTFLIDSDRTGAELEGVIDDEDDAAIAAVTVAEMLVGVELSRGKAKSERRRFLDDVLAVVPVLDYDVHVAEAHARLLVEVRKRGRPRGAHDLLIAATALASERTVLTADLTAFEDLPGVALLAHR